MPAGQGTRIGGVIRIFLTSPISIAWRCATGNSEASLSFDRCSQTQRTAIAMTETHCETALRHIQRVVTIASAENAPITLSEALEQIAETLDLAGFAPGVEAGPTAATQEVTLQ